MELNGAAATLDQIKALALTNYGHFTSMFVERNAVRGLSLHMQRLVRDCRLLFDAELDTSRVRDYVRRALAHAEQPTVVRVTVYDPDLGMGMIGGDAHPSILVTTRSAAHGQPKPWRIQSISYRREEPATKHVGLFGAMRHRRLVQREGFDDALLLNPDGTISELVTSNIGFVRNGQVVWPRSEYLTGITMTLLRQALDEPAITEPLTLSDLAGMDAAFATNAATGIRPIISVDGTAWPGDHAVLRELSDLYADIPSEQL